MTPPTAPNLTIGDVIAHIDRMIERCIRERSKLGYFAMLYRNVTARVQQAIAAGRFEDGPRMERLDVIFASRYLDALDQFWRGEAPTRSWWVAFRAARLWPPIILQHVLLGVNAHINLDLAIAAAQTAPGNELPALQRDFDEITVLLNEMILEVQARIEQVSPWFWLLDRVGGRTDEQLCAFALRAARHVAWRAAEQLSVATPKQFEQAVAFHDQLVAGLGRGLYFPNFRLGTGLLLIRLREMDDVPKVIEALRM
jgi:hypothetical protein